MARRTCLCGVTLTVHDEGVTLKAHDSPPVPLTATQAQGATPGAYTGPYEADALFSPQTFATEQRLMLRDFRVNAINYTEAPNDTGITVTIGG